MHVLILYARLCAWLTVSVVKLAIWTVRITFRLLGMLVGLPFRRQSTTHGSARWARLREVWWGGAIGTKGLIVGRYWGRFLRFNSEGYALVFARTRSGKGAGIVVPALLDWPGSVICTDPKAENLAITGRARHAYGEVYSLNVIDPELSDGFNPLDMIRLGTFHEADDAVELAKLLITPDTAGGAHWDNRPQTC